MKLKKFNWNFSNLRLKDNTCKWFSEIIEDKNIDFSILGIPMDLGVNFRPGAHFAPNTIREELAKNSCFLMDKRKDFATLKLKDYGDISLGNSFCKAHIEIEKTIEELELNETKTIFLGGDHSITYSTIRSLKDVEALILFDAHLDCRKPIENFEHSGNWLYKILEENIIEPNNIFILGASGNNYSPHYLEKLENKGITIFTVSEFRKRNVIEEIVRILKNKITYVSFDIDCIDQSQAPGTSVPSSNGFFSYEIYDSIYILSKEEKIKYLDIVEVNPILDKDNITSKVASQVTIHFLAGFSRKE